MKKVFSSHEAVAHVFSLQNQEEGQASRIFFEKNIIYSYGRHYKIAVIVDNEKKIALFNSSGYSSSTGKHKSIVRYALNYYTFFNVPCLDITKNKEWCKASHRENITYYITQIKDLIVLYKRANKLKAMRYEQLTDMQAEYKKYVDYFRIKSLLNTEAKRFYNINLNDMEEQADKLLEEAKHRARIENKRRLKRQKEREQENKHQIESWINGESNNCPYGMDKVYLRVKDNKIETSKHATADIKEARILYKRIKQGKDVNGFKIAGYTVILWDNDILKIGCHSISNEEIKRLAKALKWDK